MVAYSTKYEAIKAALDSWAPGAPWTVTGLIGGFEVRANAECVAECGNRAVAEAIEVLPEILRAVCENEEARNTSDEAKEELETAQRELKEIEADNKRLRDVAEAAHILVESMSEIKPSRLSQMGIRYTKLIAALDKWEG